MGYEDQKGLNHGFLNYGRQKTNMDYIRQLTIVLLVAFAGCTAPVPEKTLQAGPFFCPHDSCEDIIISSIGNARETIDVAIYSLTSEDISRAIMKAHKRGVNVRVIADFLQSQSRSSRVQELSAQGIKVKIFPNGTVMHDKFAVIDNSTVITGSYNWTKGASYSNKENFIIIVDKGLARKYEDEFFRLWVEAS